MDLLRSIATVVGALVLLAWLAGMLGLIDFHIYIGPARNGRDDMQHNAAINVTTPAHVEADGVFVVERTHNIGGVLTTEHPASSYGQPVFVAQEGSGFDGTVYGPADVDDIDLTPDVDHMFGDGPDLAAQIRAAAVRAGFNFRA